MNSAATAQPIAASVLSESEQRHLARQLIIAMLAAGLVVLHLLWRVINPNQSGIGQLMLICAALLVASPVLRSAWHALRFPDLHGVTDMLIAIAMLSAWALGDLLTAVLLPVVMIFGHVLEERSVVGSHEAIAALTRLTQSKARIIAADGNVVEVDNSQLKVGDHVEVRAGDRIPADGRVMTGQASVDTASITGESVPVDVQPGAEVYGGAINLDGWLRVEVVRTGGQSTLGKVIALMQSAERSKPPITRLLERYASQYLVLVLLIAATTWFLTSNVQAMLAVLVASCPCALAVAAPATAVAGLAVAARHGILIRGSAFLEELADITSLVIDKTGTLTFGSLRLEQVQVCGPMDDFTIKKIAASLGAASSHPVSRALAKQVTPQQYVQLSNIRERSGFGVLASTSYGEAMLGRPELFTQFDVTTPAVPSHAGPIAGLALNGTFLAWLLFADTIRPEARDALVDLRQLGLQRQLLLTGDRLAVATAMAQQVGIDHVVAQALPEDKLQCVMQEIGMGHRPLVAGDGVNDSLALKAGVVGVAMGSGGSDIALSSADVVLIGNDLRRLSTCVRLSRRCRRTLQLNVLIGMSWTVLIMGAAAFGLLGLEGALIAALLQNLSMLIVLANAGRLLRFQELLTRIEA